MSLAQNIARKPIAEFFAAAEVKQAHWYSIREAKDGAYCHDVNLVFPLLSSLLSIHKDILTAVKEIAALLYKRKAVSSPLLRAWEDRAITPKAMLQISTLSMTFAAAIGTLELPTITTNYEQNSDVDSQSGIDRESESKSDLKRDSMEEEKQDVNVLHPSINLPPNEFPLLNSLGVQNESQMNGLL